MNYELITIIITIIGTGAVVSGLIVPRLSTIDEQFAELSERIAKLTERMARLEGLFEGFTGRS